MSSPMSITLSYHLKDQKHCSPNSGLSGPHYGTISIPPPNYGMKWFETINTENKTFVLEQKSDGTANTTVYKQTQVIHQSPVHSYPLGPQVVHYGPVSGYSYGVVPVRRW